jgi:phosphotransferase system enzyme I (PtsI)
MITSVAEVNRIQAISRQIKEELIRENIPFADIKEGIMIETPAAALISDELAEMVDFFSIGTNDLTQYTLAIDRQNGKLDSFYDSHHKAVLRMIKIVTENAHKAGITVGICGELAADPELTEWFADIGVDELSVVPAYILKMRQMIRQLP